MPRTRRHPKALRHSLHSAKWGGEGDADAAAASVVSPKSASSASSMSRISDARV